MKITELKHIHFTGIKGVGMAGLALCCFDLGIKVTGSDIDEYFVTDDTLKTRGIKWTVGFEGDFKEKPELLVTTAAHGGLKNPEAVRAKAQGIEVITYAEALARFARSKKLISVCGVGGKTTTSSMLAVLLEHADLKPSFVVGVGNIYPISTPAKFREEGNYFICEADEYAISPGINNSPKFTLLEPYITIVTNIEHDHPDIYPAFDDTKKAFRSYFDKIPKSGLLVACIDNTNVERMVEKLSVPVISYGFNKDSDYVISNSSYTNQKTEFTLTHKGKKIRVKISVPGKYNIQNATAALIAGKHIGIAEDLLLSGIEKYKGCKRRFEFIGEKGGILYYDDYAHHPDEIKSLLEAFNEWFPERRIISIFQPHTYSRTKTLLDDFADSFMYADKALFMDIYASSREKVDKSINSKILTGKVKAQNKEAEYTGDKKATLGWIKNNVKPGDVVVTIGAGDIFHLHRDIL